MLRALASSGIIMSRRTLRVHELYQHQYADLYQVIEFSINQLRGNARLYTDSTQGYLNF